MKNALLKKIPGALDDLMGRYEPVVADGKLLEKAFDVRRVAYRDELRPYPGSRQTPSEPDDLDEKSVHMIARDRRSGEIVGALRMTQCHELEGKSDFEKEYAIHHFPKSLRPRVAIVSRLAVLPEHRKGGVVGKTLANFCYEIGMLDSFISCIVCEPTLYPRYRKWGYRPLDTVHTSPFGGYSLPLFLVAHDYDNLASSHSPFYEVAKKLDFPQFTEGQEWYLRFRLKNGVVNPGFDYLTPEEEREFHSLLTDNLSAKGKHELLSGAVAVKFKYGETVLAHDTTGRHFGLVKSGALEVRKGTHFRTLLGPGDVFGEVSFILDVPRSADVVSVAEDTEILLFNQSVFERFSNPSDSTHLWENFSKFLAQRLRSSNR